MGGVSEAGAAFASCLFAFDDRRGGAVLLEAWAVRMTRFCGQVRPRPLVHRAESAHWAVACEVPFISAAASEASWRRKFR